MNILGIRKISYTISAFLVGVSILSFLIFGLKLGIDFTGGSILEVEYQTTRPSHDQLAEVIQALKIGSAIIQPTNERGVIVRMNNLSETEHQAAINALASLGALIERRFDSIGPTIGTELRRNSLWAIILVMVMIILYISWAFRHVSRPMASWKYGVAAIIALVHDIAIPTGLFVFLGYFYGVEVDTLFVTALLTILGFSVHDTIVVFDRIRENLRKYGLGDQNFERIVEESVKSTMTRSINTSLTVFFVMLMLYLFGGYSTRMFALAILVGVFFGTYSSIFIASALLVSWHTFSLRRAQR